MLDDEQRDEAPRAFSGVHIEELAPDVSQTSGVDDAVPGEQLVEAGITVSVDRAAVALRMLPFAIGRVEEQCRWRARGRGRSRGRAAALQRWHALMISGTILAAQNLRDAAAYAVIEAGLNGAE